MAKQSPSSTAQRNRGLEFSQKQIRGTVIFGRFVTCLKLKPDIDLKKSLTDLLKGGLVKWDLGLELMRFKPLKDDGLVLQKADVMKAKTVGNLSDLVFKWYSDNGWTIGE
jgi:hypothetical protein